MTNEYWASRLDVLEREIHALRNDYRRSEAARVLVVERAIAAEQQLSNLREAFKDAVRVLEAFDFEILI